MIKGKLVFKGNFRAFFLVATGLTVLSIVTFGLFLPYMIYWQVKYFASHIEVEMADIWVV